MHTDTDVRPRMTIEKCPECKGSGNTLKVDIAKGRSMKLVCNKCKGTGEIRTIINGPRIGVIYAPTIFFQMLREGKIVATLECRQRQITDDAGRPLVRINKSAMFRRDQEVPRNFLEIARMNTRPEWRKQGIMTELLCIAAGNKEIEYIETLWDDSTEDGRAFLLSHGFRRENERLVWEKTASFPIPCGIDYSGNKQPAPGDDRPELVAGTDRHVHDSCSERETNACDQPESPASA